MTYCLAACVDAGLVFVSDSRTNAGIDRLGVHSKMHAFTDTEGRFFTLLSAGNLATTQAVVAELRRDVREGARTSLATVGRLRDAADYVGSLNRKIVEKYGNDDSEEGFNPSADFIFGGQIGDNPHALFHVYAQGNYISPTALVPFLQLGEQKYGRPILDRIIQMRSSLATVALCGLVSMDSTMRSNASVGPPIEVMIYRASSSAPPVHIVYAEDHPYLRTIRESWAVNLRRAFDDLPPLSLPEGDVRLVEK
ncbi:MAG: peptidase [Gammaproteobacteria bacterium]|nr:peptidase [Gammaproteobacteria bacterium]